MKKKMFAINRQLLGLTMFLIFFPMIAFAQSNQIKGIVTDAQTGEALVGVSVIQKNTTNGSVTDLDGAFQINAPINSDLVFSYLGYENLEVKASSQSLNVRLKEATKLIDEVVIVGYGVQKKSVVTAAISSVKGDDLALKAPTRIDNVLKGMVSGVNITQASGQPGDGSKVRIRGIGTINNSDPLYIVDGMPISGGIDNINPADVLSVEVLKDAASAAIYGTRGANGVILVTTKQGKSGKAVVNYNFTYGWQNAAKKRAVLDATEYAILMNEQNMNSGKSPIYSDPQSYGRGTDWQKEVFNADAPMYEHQVSVAGGSDKGNYYLSLGYFNQEGIVGGNFGRSNYERYSIRLNNNYTVFDESKTRSILSTLKIGSNLTYGRINSTGIGTNSEFGSVLGSALSISPMLPVLAQDPEATLAAHPTAVRDRNGNVFTIVGDQYNEITNPLAYLSLPPERNNSDKILANFWGELELYKNLKFKSSYGVDLAFWGTDGYIQPYYLGKSNHVDESRVWSSMNRGFTWQIENTLSYQKQIEDHSFTVLLGQSALSSRSRSLWGQSYLLRDTNPDRANIDFTDQPQKAREASGRMSPYYRLASYFGRLSYNYQERYMGEFTFRKDGSTKFGPSNKWANFYSVSLGWNITNEKFMANRPDFITSLKLRGSWGQNGNDQIGDFRYTTMIDGGNNYILGKEGAIIVAPGSKPNGYPNETIGWEESEQTNIGIDTRFFNGALSFTVDWFDKRTNGMLMQMPLPAYIGDTPPMGNVGDMKNTGIEFDASYQFKVGDVSLHVGGNASYIKNELIELGNSNGWANYDAIQSIGTITRAANGEPFPFFYGLKTNGIFQTQQEINEYVNKDGKLIQPKAQPGDVRFVDINGDGVINDEDRTKLGKGMPDWMFGFNVGAQWKGFDLNIILQGTSGNDIFDGTRRIDLASINLPGYMLDRWTGPGSSNRIPRLTLTDDNGNWQSSDLYVKDGSFLRVKNLQIGYNLPATMVKKAYLGGVRVYVSAENLLTFTSYDGFEPEISSGGTSLGVDRGVYPQARTVSIGANITF
ncbi:SusC/RagA family TonB-linked outer membrane protein [Dysgonomonas sp. GY617]|uniref:SusC/RagA family TonB-linked outer membrane protein n=1 Tax=Dysgonomonas sp. GY617 TaxID=2780420 RepID=UPI001F554BC6|nr:TonB-dependent receptor [Dysgonomonas sp. GY617]